MSKSQPILRMAGLLLLVFAGATLTYAQAGRKSPAFERFRKAYKSSDFLEIEEAVSDLLESGDLSQVKAHLLTVVKAPKSSTKTLGGSNLAFYVTTSCLKHRVRSVVPELIKIAEQQSVKEDQLELIDRWIKEMGKAGSPFIPVLEKRMPFDRVPDAMMTKALGIAAMRYEITGSYEGMIPLLERALKSDNFSQQFLVAGLISEDDLSDETMNLAATFAKLYCFPTGRTDPQQKKMAGVMRSRLRNYFFHRNQLAKTEIIRAVAEQPSAKLEYDCLDFLLQPIDPSSEMLAQLDRIKEHESARNRAIVLRALVRGGKADQSVELKALKNVLVSNKNPFDALTHLQEIEVSLTILSRMKNLPDDIVEAAEPFLKSPVVNSRFAAAKIVWNARRDPECLKILVDSVPVEGNMASEQAAAFLASLGPAGAPMLPMIKEKLRLLIEENRADEKGCAELLKVAAQYRGEARDLIPEITQLIDGKYPVTRSTAAMTHYWITGESRLALAEIKRLLDDSNIYIASHGMFSLDLLGDDGKELKDAVKKFYERDVELARFTAAKWLEEFTSDGKQFQVELIRRGLKIEGKDGVHRCLRAAFEPGLPVKAFEAELEQFVEFGDNYARGAAAFALVVNKGSVQAIESERKNLLKSTATHPLSLFALLAIKPDDLEAMTLLEKYLSNMAINRRADALQPVARLGTRGAFAEKLVLACTEEGGEMNQETAREILKVIRGEVPFKSKKERLPPKPIQYVY